LIAIYSPRTQAQSPTQWLNYKCYSVTLPSPFCQQ